MMDLFIIQGVLIDGLLCGLLMDYCYVMHLHLGWPFYVNPMLTHC